jgi:uncharacterized ion transporter superfamily protein YfcC
MHSTDADKTQPENDPAAPAAGRGRTFRWEMPDTLVIIFLVTVLAAVSTYWIPVESFDTRRIEYTQGDTVRARQALIPESFKLDMAEDGSARRQTVSLFTAESGNGEVERWLPSGAVSERGVLNSVFDGLTSGDRYGTAVGVVAFILIIGGAFGIVLRTGAVEAAILWLIHRLAGYKVLCLPVFCVLFSLGGAVFGMSAEAIVLAMVVVPMAVWMGYDSITGVMVTYGASQVGFATSWMNPFSVAVAQGMAEVPVLSGAGFRFGMWAFFTALCVGVVLWHARKVRRNPESSLTFKSDDWFRNLPGAREGLKTAPLFSWGDRVVVALFALGVVWIVWGVTARGYFIAEIATQFLAIGNACGLAAVLFRLRDMRLNSIADSFRDGASQLVEAALVVGMAKGIVLVLGGGNPTEPSVINTVLHGASLALRDLSAPVAAGAMYAFQCMFNFFVPSGSGQAALTMPIMGPLADLTGLSRQIAVLAFQLGDGLTNLVIPTSASLMGTLAVARIPWTTWIRFQWRIQLILFAAGFGFLCLGIAVGL